MWRRGAGGEGELMSRQLSDEQAHLWWADPAAFHDSVHLARYRHLLTEAERAKVDRFRFTRDRHTALMTRVLVRVVLSRYCDVTPREWRFHTNHYGRPEVAMPRCGVRFNLSHTAGLVVCLVSRGREVGVDAENLSREGAWLELAERFFAPTEAAAVRKIDESRRRRRFLEYWTLKESYIKARGMGLAIPLDGFSFDLNDSVSEGIEIRFAEAVCDDPVRWQFTLEPFSTEHLVATAIECHQQRSVRLSRFEVTEPLIAEALG